MTEEILHPVSADQRAELNDLLQQVRDRLGERDKSWLHPQLAIRSLQALLNSLNPLDPRDFLYLTLPPDELDRPIEDLDFSIRTYNCLKREGVHNVRDLLQWSEAELLDIRNFGDKSLGEVKANIVSQGWHLSPHSDRYVKPPPGDQWVMLQGDSGHVTIRRLLSSAMGYPVAAVLPDPSETRSDLITCLERFGIVTVGQILDHGVDNLASLPWGTCELSRSRVSFPDPNGPAVQETRKYTLDPAEAAETIIEGLKASEIPISD